MMRILRRLAKNPLYVVSLAVIIIMVLTAIFPSLIAPYDPLEMGMDYMKGPTSSHIFGTDQFGRDIFSRCVYGIQNSMIIAINAILFSALFGTVLGLVAGYYGGIVDATIMRFTDAFFAFPSLILALFIVALFGTSVSNLIVAIGIVYIPIFTRTIRGSALTVREGLYVKASRALGVKDVRIMLKDILPNVSSILIVSFTTNLSTAFLTEASLGFLGLGVQPPIPTLGGMVGKGTNFLLSAPWIALFPGLVIAIIVLSINILGDGLRDILDPRLMR